MTPVSIIGASGYTGAELVGLLVDHPQVKIEQLWVSENSVHAGAVFSDLYPKWRGRCDLNLKALTESQYEKIAKTSKIVFLATDHKVSLEIAPRLLDLGVIVIDLSGAFRLSEAELYTQHYGFSHTGPNLLQEAAYGLPEWYQSDIRNAQLIAVPGCYPTSAILALKPLVEADAVSTDTPIVNSISGVSGAGKKPSETNAFCEVSLKPYGSFTHRHQPEIDQYTGIKTLFQPHLGPYKRGILTTLYVKMKTGFNFNEVDAIFTQAYQASPFVRLVSTVPCVSQVEGTPYCDIAYCLKEDQLIVFSAIDNLLKGASSQAVQCMNIKLKLEESLGLL